jgi:hypothetical protein
MRNNYTYYNFWDLVLTTVHHNFCCFRVTLGHILILCKCLATPVLNTRYFKTKGVCVNGVYVGLMFALNYRILPNFKFHMCLKLYFENVVYFKIEI